MTALNEEKNQDASPVFLVWHSPDYPLVLGLGREAYKLAFTIINHNSSYHSLSYIILADMGHGNF